MISDQASAASGYFYIMSDVTLYLLPSILALAVRKRRPGVVVWANVLLGWTGIAWLLCLFGALLGERTPPLAPKTAPNNGTPRLPGAI
jgi:hypothetical protein